MLKKILQEPLVHFLVLGALLFVIADLRGSGPDPSSRIVEVTAERVQQLALIFERTWQRPPSDTELRGLIDDFVKEEIYYREARSLGLDQDDTTIRRHLRQKLEFLTDEMGSVAPTDEQLQSYLEEHPEKFRLLPRYRLKHIFFSVDRRGAAADTEARLLLSKLPTGTWPEGGTDLGDRVLVTIPEGFTDAVEISRQFGSVFAEKLAGLPLGEWSGPIRSGYGLHLVLITDREEGRLPLLDEVRPMVEREWSSDRRAEVAKATYDEIASRYEVRVDVPLDSLLPGAEAPAVGEELPGNEEPSGSEESAMDAEPHR